MYELVLIIILSKYVGNLNWLTIKNYYVVPIIYILIVILLTFCHLEILSMIQS